MNVHTENMALDHLVHESLQENKIITLMKSELMPRKRQSKQKGHKTNAEIKTIIFD